MQTIFIHEPGWSHTHKLPKTFHTVNWNGILLVSCCFLWNSASFSVGKPKSATKTKVLNWPPWKQHLLKTTFLPDHIDHHRIIFCFHAQCLSQRIKSLDCRLHWLIVFITLKNFVLTCSLMSEITRGSHQSVNEIYICKPWRSSY